MDAASTVASDIHSAPFRAATLRSEQTRVMVVLSVFASVFVLVAIRGVTSIAAGLRGEALPFAALLGIATVYEAIWLRYVRRAINATVVVSTRTWISNLFIESILPTIALFLQIHTSFVGPGRALTSPVLLLYFLLIIFPPCIWMP